MCTEHRQARLQALTRFANIWRADPTSSIHARLGGTGCRGEEVGGGGEGGMMVQGLLIVVDALTAQTPQVCMPKEPYKRALLHSKEAY